MREVKPLVVLEPQRERADGDGMRLSGMFLAYIQDSNRASVERTRVREEARIAVEAERERTERHRIHADRVIAGQRQETERARLRADADVRIAKERRSAPGASGRPLRSSRRGLPCGSKSA